MTDGTAPPPPPREYWAWLEDDDGVPTTEEVAGVMSFSGEDENGMPSYVTRLSARMRCVPGGQKRPPRRMAMRFSDGTIAYGPVPPGSWELGGRE